MECSQTLLSWEDIFKKPRHNVICSCSVISFPILPLGKNNVSSLENRHTYFSVALMFCVGVSLYQYQWCAAAFIANANHAGLSGKRRSLLIAIHVHSFCSLSGFTLPVHSWKVCTDLSLIKNMFDSYSASVWKQPRCMWRGLLVFCFLRRVCECKGGEITEQ